MLARELTPYGKDLKCQLVKLGMTQKELAGKVGTSKQYLGKIIFGERAGTMYLDSIEQEVLSSQKAAKKVTLTPYGQEVKCRLIELNMTQVELAELVGTTKQYLGKILHGKRSGEMYIDRINQTLGLGKETLKVVKTRKSAMNDESLIIRKTAGISIPA